MRRSSIDSSKIKALSRNDSIKKLKSQLPPIYNEEIFNSNNPELTDEIKYQILENSIDNFRMCINLIAFCVKKGSNIDKILSNVQKNDFLNKISELRKSVDAIYLKIKSYFNKTNIEKFFLIKDLKKYQEIQKDIADMQKLIEESKILNKERNLSANYSKQKYLENINHIEKISNKNKSQIKKTNKKNIHKYGFKQAISRINKKNKKS